MSGGQREHDAIGERPAGAIAASGARALMAGALSDTRREGELTGTSTSDSDN